VGGVQARDSYLAVSSFKLTRAANLNQPPAMISDGTLTDISNGLGVAAMVLIVAYHFVAVNSKRMSE
jgi:hypothetical protein